MTKAFLPIPRDAVPIRNTLERLDRDLAEFRRRKVAAEQSEYGWYDDDGVRQGGLIAFVRYFWHVLEPATKLVEGWALYAVVEHLEAVTRGEIKRLLITVPPGFMKSLCTDVFWPAWEWGPMNLAHKRYVAFSYSASLTERDNERFRDLIIHDSYQSLWGDRVQTVKIGATKVTNRTNGWKLASSVGGVGTGERGDVVIIDDAHNIKEAESETVRNETTRWFRESISDRMNSLITGVIIVIMQRAHEDDVAGVILTLGLPYVHLMIPMEYDWSRQTDDSGEPKKTAIGWSDPRYDADGPDYCDGMLAWKDRFPEQEVADIKLVKGPYAYAGQYMQAPAPRGGGIFKRAWWQLWDSPDGKFPVLHYVWASLDGAFTEKESNSPSALTVWGTFTDKESKQRRIILIHAWRKFIEFSGMRIERLPKEIVTAATSPAEARYRNHLYRLRTMPSWGLIEWLADTCDRFKVDKLLIEAKASGMSAASELQNRYQRRNWSVQLEAVCGDKYSRALAVQPTFSQLLVYAPIRDWSDMVIDEMATFPKHRYTDLTDSASQALKHARDTGLANTDDEVSATEIERVTHRPKQKALYPV